LTFRAEVKRQNEMSQANGLWFSRLVINYGQTRE